MISIIAMLSVHHYTKEAAGFGSVGRSLQEERSLPHTYTAKLCPTEGRLG